MLSTSHGTRAPPHPSSHQHHFHSWTNPGNLQGPSTGFGFILLEATGICQVSSGISPPDSNSFQRLHFLEFSILHPFSAGFLWNRPDLSNTSHQQGNVAPFGSQEQSWDLSSAFPTSAAPGESPRLWKGFPGAVGSAQTISALQSSKPRIWDGKFGPGHRAGSTSNSRAQKCPKISD